MTKRSTISITLEGALNAVAKNKDGNQVAAAGRTVFKILQINDEESKFTELMNMRVGKNINLNWSCNDVVWNHLDSNILATGATNGAVVIWRIDKASRSKMDCVYRNDHKRTVNKVCFHPNEANLLISGSQDGRMNLFDLRSREQAVATFLSQSESVRDVQFSRFRDNTFSSIQENGNVQIWNLRRPDHYEKQFTAHSGPVFSCDWHLEDQRFLATAGRDKTIKIWDISSSKPQLEHCIQAIASVARIKWRPQQRTHIASSSLVVDFNIYIWDYIRPFVPFANIQEHKDVATDFIWRDANANVLISVGKDGTVSQHLVDEVENPWLKANPCALNLNNSGDIFLATSNYLIKDISPMNIINYMNTGKDSTATSKDSFLNSDRSSSNSKNLNISLSNNLDHYSQSSTNVNSQQNISSSLNTTASAVTLMKRSMQQIFQHNQSISSPSGNQSQNQPNNQSQQQNNQQMNAIQTNLMKMKLFTSSAVYFKNKNACKAISMDWFVKTALNYQLTGRPLGELFEHNANVAQTLDRLQIAQTWRILKQLYVGTSLSSNQSSKPQPLSTSSLANNPLMNSTIMNSTMISSATTPTSIKQTTVIATNLLSNSSANEHTIIKSDKANDLKTRNLSGQQSRHASGSAIVSQHANMTPSSVTESSTLANRSNQFTTRNRIATYSGPARTSLATTTSAPLSASHANKNFSSVISHRNESDADESDDMIDQPQTTPLDKEFGREHQAADFFFGDGDVNETHGLTSYDVGTNDILTELDTQINPNEVQREAFQTKHEIPDFTAPPDLDLINNDLNALNLVDEIEMVEDDFTSANQTNSKKLVKDQNVERLLSVETEANPPYKFSDIIVEMLRFYANQGDVQTTVSILIILGKHISHAIDLATQEHWFHSYIDLLSRFQLWNIINQVSNLSVLPSINSLNQISTTIYTSCAGCNKPINQNKVGWYCERCKQISSVCSVCHEVVKGIYVWCRICSHGGHINHLQKWFEKNKTCSSGCGHLCEYN